MTDLQLSQVEHFKIERPGYGSVEWLVPVDLRKLNLDELVLIDKEDDYPFVDVYPNVAPEDYPDVGSELNNPSRIVLYKVFPMKGMEMDDFVKSLRTTCAQNDTVFIGYDRKEGTWSFNAKHFTRYGYNSESSTPKEDVCYSSM